MKKLILLSIIIVFSGILKAQTFPYLNASTGNEGQYIVDNDTNIIMFHNNRIEKLDKNFNPIWVKTYSGLNFYSLLLSKTGSIYFISTNIVNNIIGKLTNNGDIVWCRQYNALTSSGNLYQLFLDRNSNITISGVLNNAEWFLKLDTLGNTIYSKKFQAGMPFGRCHIIDDSLGVYRFVGEYAFIHGKYTLHLKYNEINNSIIDIKGTEGSGEVLGVDTKYFKSKLNPFVYYSFQRITEAGNIGYGYLVKYYKDNVVAKTHYNISFGPYFMNSFDEDQYGNVIYTVSNYYMNNGYEHYTTKIDSTFSTGFVANYFSGINFSNSNTSVICGKIHALVGDKYFLDLYGNVFTSNPLLITKIDSSLTTSCKTSMPFISNPLPIYNWASLYESVQIINDPVTSDSLSPIATPITNFSIYNNYCLSVGVNSSQKKNVTVIIYPNPASTILNIDPSVNIIEVSVFDIHSKKIFVSKHFNTVDISMLNSGMYFIKIKTDQGEFSQKFIKE